MDGQLRERVMVMPEIINGVTLNGERQDFVSGVTQRELSAIPLRQVRNVRVTARKRGARKVRASRVKTTYGWLDAHRKSMGLD